MSGTNITWWFDREITRLEALRAELLAFSEAAAKKGATVRRPPDPSYNYAEATLPNGWTIEVDVRQLRRQKMKLTYSTWVRYDRSTIARHNTWRQALRRAVSGGGSWPPRERTTSHGKQSRHPIASQSKVWVTTRPSSTRSAEQERPTQSQNECTATGSASSLAVFNRSSTASPAYRPTSRCPIAVIAAGA